MASLVTLCAMFYKEFRDSIIGSTENNVKFFGAVLSGTTFVAVIALFIVGSHQFFTTTLTRENEALKSKVTDLQSRIGTISKEKVELVKSGSNLKFKPLEQSPTCVQYPKASPRPTPSSSSNNTPENLKNLARLLVTTITTNSILATSDPNLIGTDYLNDGYYNPCRTWIPNSLPGIIEFDLGSEFEVYSVHVTADYYNVESPGRRPTKIRFESSTDGLSNDWTNVAKYDSGPITGPVKVLLSGKRMRYLRVIVTDTYQNFQPRVDEIEIWGRLPPGSKT